ncbi:HIT family protein [Nanoarchaeota archaeon]
MTCQECQVIKEKRGQLLYEDPYVYVVLAEKPATIGHIQVYSKKHAVSFDNLNHDESQHMLSIANLASSVLFEQLGAHGTNIILHEGDLFGNHLVVEVLARKDGDGLDFNWDAQQVSDANMEDVQKKIQGRAELIGRVQPSATPEQAQQRIKAADDNYLTKNVKKLP